MGTCYSKSGHDAAEGNSKNQPISKESGRHQPNGSLYVYRPGKNHDTQPASASQSGNMGGQEKSEEGLKINTIDSGIESLTSSQCNKELKELAENSELREATDTFELIDNGPCACGENCEVNGQCKFECLSKLPESNVEWTSAHGRPLSQPARKGIESSIIHRKPRGKGRIERKSSRLSWKSTDSLDWTRTMVTTMDRTTSQVSDIFVDDISLHAPLAHFDSIEFSGEDKEVDANGAAKAALKTTAVAVTANTIETAPSTCSATILISNDKQTSSVCEKPVESMEIISVQSTDRMSKDFNIENLEDIVKKQLSSQSLLGSREGENSSLAGSLLSFPPKSEVTSVVVDGKEVVLIDADTYSQVMDEIALLKTKLGQLTSVIQTESLSYCDPNNVQSAAWQNRTMDGLYSFDRNSLVGTPDILNGVEEQLLGNASSSAQPLTTDAPSSAEPLPAETPPMVAPQVTGTPSMVEHQVVDTPSTVEHKVTDLTSSVENKVTDLTSTVENKVTDLTSSVENKVTDLTSTVENKVTDLTSSVENKVTGPTSTVENKVTDLTSTVENKVTDLTSTVEHQAVDLLSNVEQKVTGPTSTVEHQVVDLTSTVKSQVADLPSTVEHQAADLPSTTVKQQVVEPPSTVKPPSTVEHQFADPSSSPENLSADISLLAEKLVAEVLPVSAAEVAKAQAMKAASSAEPQNIKSSPTEMLDPAPPKAVQEPISSPSAPTSSEDKTALTEPSTKAENTSPKT